MAVQLASPLAALASLADSLDERLRAVEAVRPSAGGVYVPAATITTSSATIQYPASFTPATVEAPESGAFVIFGQVLLNWTWPATAPSVFLYVSIDGAAGVPLAGGSLTFGTGSTTDAAFTGALPVTGYTPGSSHSLQLGIASDGTHSITFHSPATVGWPI